MPKVINIKCPHCGAIAKAVLPPEGLIVLGPCPSCREFVLLLANIPLPVDKEIIVHGTSEERYEHILSVINSFIEQRVATLVEQIDNDPYQLDDSGETVGGQEVQTSSERPHLLKAITSEEMRRFVEEELPRLDDSEYFNMIFH